MLHRPSSLAPSLHEQPPPIVRSCSYGLFPVLSNAEYVQSRVDWINKLVWPHHCRRWCKNEFLDKRHKAQESRMAYEDVAQNRGGSRAFGETSQFLEHKFGPGKGSTINTYAVMKSGMKNVETNGRSGPIISSKAQTRLNDYTSSLQDAQLEEDLEQQDVDGKVLYKTSDGLRQGRVTIADGAVRKADVIAAGKETHVRPSTTSIPVTVQNLARDNKRLLQSNERLLNSNAGLSQLNNQPIMMLYADLGREPSGEILQQAQEIQAQQAQEIHAQGATGSSHNHERNNDGCDNNHEGNNDGCEDNSSEDEAS
ncbi:hypothetical protein EJB05_40522, partial [Eragrostis curvula]